MSRELEEAIVGAVLTRPRRLLDVDLEATWFAVPQCRRVFIAVAELTLRDGLDAIDLAIVQRHLAESGEQIRLTELVDLQMADGVDLPGLSRELRKVHERRTARVLAERLVVQLRDETGSVREVLGEATERFFDLLTPGESHVTAYRDAMAKRAHAALTGEGNGELVPTGFPVLDDTLRGGLPRGGLTIVGARPGRGKSSLLQQVIEQVARRGERALLCTPEMAWHEVGDRALSRASRVPLSDLRARWLTETQRSMLTSARLGQDAECLLYDYARQTSRDVARMARRIALGGPVSVVAVDYVQFLADRPQRGEARYEVLGQVARRLKATARAVNAALIAGAQLKRESQGREPTLADLRESGDLEQDADVVLLLCEPQDDLVKVLVEKNRNGPTGFCWFRWRPEWTEFVSEGAA